MKKSALAFILVFSLLLCSCSMTVNIPVSPAEDFEYEMVEGYVVITKYIGTALEINIPEKINDRPVVNIGEEAFEGYDMTKVVLPDSIVSIGEDAFADCVCLEEIHLGKGLIRIGSRAFNGCEKLRSIDFPENIISIEDHAFSDCTALVKVEVPGLQEVGDYIFSGCTALKEASLSNGLVTMGVGMFRGCESLEKVSFPDSLKNIGAFSFAGCSTLNSVSLPGELSVLGKCAFEDCTAMRELKIPDNMISYVEWTSEYTGIIAEVELNLPTATYKARVANFTEYFGPQDEAVTMACENLIQEIQTKEKPNTILVIANGSLAWDKIRSIEHRCGINLQEEGFYRIEG